MKNRRQTLLLGLMVAALGLVVSIAWLWFAWPRHRLSQDSFDKIKAGMTREEVEAILGCPPGDYATQAGFSVSMGPPGALDALSCTRERWVGNEAIITVWFD